MAPRLDADAVVVGGGPAGCAAAAALARGGARVVLAERWVFPRDKVCGDGLLPDALDALAGLGLAEATAGSGHGVRGIAFRTPGGREGVVSVAAAVLPRRRLDALLLDAARAAGAEVVEGASLVAVRDGGREVELRRDRGTLRLRTAATVLATGAGAAASRAAGLGAYRRPPAAALRGYAVLGGRDEGLLEIDFGAGLPGGYRWAFPVGGGLWNLGCGVLRGRPAVSLRREAERLLRELGGLRWEEAPRGAPLRTHFPRGPLALERILVAGDAAGLTRPLSGEGIGPALSSGGLAAAALLSGDGDPGPRYERLLRRRFGRDFRGWRLGERLLARPGLIEAIVGRVAAAPRVRERIKAVLANRVPAHRVLSPTGIVRALLGR